MSLIINNPVDEPQKHWQRLNDGKLELKLERRPASYEIINTVDQTRRVQEIALVNTIRGRVSEWRAAGYPGVTIVTRKLLDHWNDHSAREYPFYFCQIEAIETLIWWVEGAAEFKQGIVLQGDGGPWERLCNKMATGAGKTTVMAMIITWQVLNAQTYPKRNKDFSRAIFIVTPGLTVKGRLQVLYPTDGSYYDQFNLCPDQTMRQKLNDAAIMIENWHSLMPAKDQDRSVVKKGAESDEAFTRRVLGNLAGYKDIIVLNDEAHHAYRQNPKDKVGKKKAEELGLDPDEATRWVEGLDRLHKTRRISRCFDLSATPFSPSGMASSDSALFTWIVSDFGLNDAIEAGLVKTPRIVVRDDALPAADLKPKLYHIYKDPAVSEDLNRKAEPHEPLPTLVQQAYTLLGADWRAYQQEWQQNGHHSPPVLLTVCNRTETAARIEHYFNTGGAHWLELQAPNRTLRVDSKVLDKAEIGDTATANKPYEERLRSIVNAAHLSPTKKAALKDLKKEELLREIIDNVGKRNEAGQDLQNVISVAMLSEGWDAKNVTHIMGLRAFTSQLLCEQVIGRGLRRVTYDKETEGERAGLFLPEYVNVFGVPLSIFEDDTGGGGEPPPPPKPSVQIEVVPERGELEIQWPNILRVDTVMKNHLTVDWSVVPVLTLDPTKTTITAELAPAMNDASDMSQIVPINLEMVPEGFRLQRLTFVAARKCYEAMAGNFIGTEGHLLRQLVKLVEDFLKSDRLEVPSLFHQEPLRKRILVGLNMDQIVQFVVQHLKQTNKQASEIIFDDARPLGRTGDMRTWYTTKPTMVAQKSHISHVVGDSTWEGYAANVFEGSSKVKAYAKNDHLGFEISYLWNGSRRRYLPDFLVSDHSGRTLVVELKGQKTPQNDAKHAAMAEWIAALNDDGRFGSWSWAVAYNPVEVHDILAAF